MERRHFLKSAAAAGLLAANAVANSQASHPPGESPKASPPAAAGELQEKVLGIGGVFFRSTNWETLGRWYEENLGIPLSPTKIDSPVWNTEAGVTIFSPFPETTKYLGDPKQMWMLNFRVRDLSKMVTQLNKAGIAVKVDPQQYPNGRFARLHDPEGNPIELWQPA